MHFHSSFSVLSVCHNKMLILSILFKGANGKAADKLREPFKCVGDFGQLTFMDFLENGVHNVHCHPVYFGFRK